MCRRNCENAACYSADMYEATRRYLPWFGAFCVVMIAASAPMVSASVSGIPYPVLSQMMRCVSTSAAERTACYEATFPALYPDVSVPELFSAIRALQPLEPALFDCHLLAHRIGETVVALDPASWPRHMLAEGTETLCSFGYIHGITIAVYDGRAFTPEEIEAEMPTLATVCDRSGFGTIVRRSCFHGIGHMLYFLTNTDIRKSFGLCNDIIEGRAEVDEQYRRACYTGVTMKLFTTLAADEEPDWRHLSTETADAFCGSFDEDRYIGACKRASWILWFEEFKEGDGIKEFCEDQANPEETNHCYAKVFHGLAWKFIDEPERMMSVCARVARDRSLECYLNAAMERLITGGGMPVLRDAIAFCDHADTEIAQRCTKQVALYGRFFYESPDERSRYCAHFDELIRDECNAAPYE